jgi:tetratricopeptide (TPR) repeat protein
LIKKLGLDEKVLQVVSPDSNTKIATLGNAEINLLLNHPLFAIQKPAANAKEYNLLQYANQLWRLGKHSEASTILQRLIKSNKNIYIAHLMLAAILNEQNKYEESLSAVNQAIAIKPNDYNAWKFKSLVFLNLKKYPLSLEIVNKMIEDNPQDISLHLLKSGIFFVMKNHSEALATTDKAIQLQLQPLSFIYSLRGSIYLELKDYQGLVNDMNKAIQLQPDLAIAYAYRATGKLQLIDFKVIEDMVKEGQTNPNNPRFQEFALSFLKETSIILADMNKAIELEPDNQVIKDISILMVFIEAIIEPLKESLNQR